MKQQLILLTQRMQRSNGQLQGRWPSPSTTERKGTLPPEVMESLPAFNPDGRDILDTEYSTCGTIPKSQKLQS